MKSASMPSEFKCACASCNSPISRAESTTRAPSSPSDSANCKLRPREPPVGRGNMFLVSDEKPRPPEDAVQFLLVDTLVGVDRGIDRPRLFVEQRRSGIALHGGIRHLRLLDSCPWRSIGSYCGMRAVGVSVARISVTRTIGVHGLSTFAHSAEKLCLLGSDIFGSHDDASRGSIDGWRSHCPRRRAPRVIETASRTGRTVAPGQRCLQARHARTRAACRESSIQSWLLACATGRSSGRPESAN
ncbi:hypothetical protein LMG29660_06427 [Burkholderia puraquae]|uniref:Uncharacterized protein n=1 Tax=Burkholderia puraquae TaxID=1904757 RepID=A0A6J5EUS1_9BURK|nr:hypothetical protein LMG29660_06427 [Burkholderia puraquae]